MDFFLMSPPLEAPRQSAAVSARGLPEASRLVLLQQRPGMRLLALRRWQGSLAAARPPRSAALELLPLGSDLEEAPFFPWQRVDPAGKFRAWRDIHSPTKQRMPKVLAAQ